MAKLDNQVYYTTKFTNFEIALSQTPFDLPQNNGCAPLSQKTKYLTTYIKVHTATRWTIRHSLKLHWFADLMNVTEEVTIHRPNVSTLLNNIILRIHAHPCIQLEM